MKIRMVGSVAVLLAGLVLAGPSSVRAEGRITVAKATVEGCRAMGKCIWKVTCQVGKEQLVQDLRGVSRDVKEINKSFDTPGFPVNVQCKTEIDDGFFTTSWKEVGKAAASVPGGGDWDLQMVNKENGGVTVHVTADSLEIGAPAAAPAAAKGKAPAKAAKAPAAPRQYIGVFQASPQGAAVLVGMPWDQFKARADQLEAGGVRIVCLDTYDDGGRRVWSGIFKTAAEKQLLIQGISFEEFKKKYQGLVQDQHMRMLDIVSYDEGNKRLIGGAFHEGYDRPEPPWFMEPKAFEAKVAELGGKGQRLLHMDVYKTNGNKYNYAGVFHEGSGGYGLWMGLDKDAFLAKWKKGADTTQVNEVKTWSDGKKRFYDAVIGGGGIKTQIELGLDWNALAAKWKEDIGKGYRLAGLETYQD